MTGDFDQYNLDPYVSEKIVREPVTEIIDAAIIGGDLVDCLPLFGYWKQASKIFES